MNTFQNTVGHALETWQSLIDLFELPFDLHAISVVDIR